jgi:hypothetical protein
MNSTHIISQDVFDKIRSRFRNLEMGDETGNVTNNPKEARFFDFNFVVEGQNLGRVSISLNERGSLKIFYSQGILENANEFVHNLWYDFLREMRMFAKRRLLRFDTRDITKSNLNKDDFQYLASKGSEDNNMNMNESVKFKGSKKTSYRILEKTKLIAKHKNSIKTEEHGARSRGNNIKALYIENSDGERFKYPFIHIAGAKAMQRHVANGGRPYDEKGEAIVKMSEEILQLSSFKKHIGKPDGMNQRVNEITSKTDLKLESLRRTIEGLSNQSYYENWCEGFVPNQNAVELDQATMEDYKSAFTVSSFKEDLAQYFPLIHKIMHETGEIDLSQLSAQRPVHEEQSTIAVDDFAQFEEWANRLEEGKLDSNTIKQLKDLLDNGLTLDVDGRSAIDALQGIGIYDKDLENALEDLAKINPQAEPTDIILGWLATTDLDTARSLGYKESDTSERDEMPNEDISDPQSPSVKEIAEMVYSFYDRETGKFPKGETGVITHIKKELGTEAGNLAEKLVQHLTSTSFEKNNSRSTQSMNHNANYTEDFNRIVKLSGLAK